MRGKNLQSRLTIYNIQNSQFKKKMKYVMKQESAAHSQKKRPETVLEEVQTLNLLNRKLKSVFFSVFKGLKETVDKN